MQNLQPVIIDDKNQPAVETALTEEQREIALAEQQEAERIEQWIERAKEREESWKQSDYDYLIQCMWLPFWPLTFRQMKRGESEYVLDIRDVDWSAEEQKGNYIVPEESGGYRYAVHNVVDESDWLFMDEWQARMELFEHLLAIWENIKFLPHIEWMKWK